MEKHPFDQALRLEPAGIAQPDTWCGASSPAYWNMVGPFGGTTAATAVQAIMLHPALLGEPIALTANYACAMGEGPFTVTARPVRTNRSTQHWLVTLSQSDAAGTEGVVMTATAVTAATRNLERERHAETRPPFFRRLAPFPYRHVRVDPAL